MDEIEVRLTNVALDAGHLLNAFQAGRLETGAVVSFTGLARAEGGRLEALELEAYPGFTEAEIARMAAEVAARHGLHGLLVAHRVGMIAPGETIVFTAAAASHRRAAFEGADQMMDYLKSRAPFWKKSHDTAGGRWIEPRPEDYQDAARWDAPAPLYRSDPL